MRRIALLLATILVLAACGDDAGSETTTAETTADTAAPTTTTAAPTTTAAATTTAADDTNPLLEAALELQGTHSGEWNNTTFGSSGPIEIEVGVDEATEVATVTIDLGGFVFGGDDPAPIEHEFDLSIGDASFDAYEFTDEEGEEDPVFGSGVVWRFDSDGTFSIVAPSVPGVGGLEMTMEGAFTETGFEGTYVIEGLAEGTMTVVANSG